jgi:hypothetical protein
MVTQGIRGEGLATALSRSDNDLFLRDHSQGPGLVVSFFSGFKAAAGNTLQATASKKGWPEPCHFGVP